MFALLKLILKFFPAESKLPSIPKVGPSLNSKKLFLRLPALDCELLSTPKIRKFLADSLSKPHEAALSNVIP